MSREQTPTKQVHDQTRDTGGDPFASEAIEVAEDEQEGQEDRPDPEHFGVTLDAYMRARAQVEGVRYSLCPSFFDAAFDHGFRKFFGVIVSDDGRVCADEQEPAPGFLAQFLSEYQPATVVSSEGGKKDESRGSHGSPDPRPDLDRLRALLLSLGGARFQVDWYLRREIAPSLGLLLLEFGEAYAGDDAQLVPGRRGHCHQNAERLVKTQKGLLLGTGLALSADGCWRVHSWCVDAAGRIIETTVPRTLYFGVRFDPESVAREVVDSGSFEAKDEPRAGGPLARTRFEQAAEAFLNVLCAAIAEARKNNWTHMDGDHGKAERTLQFAIAGALEAEALAQFLRAEEPNVESAMLALSRIRYACGRFGQLLVSGNNGECALSRALEDAYYALLDAATVIGLSPRSDMGAFRRWCRHVEGVVSRGVDTPHRRK